MASNLTSLPQEIAPLVVHYQRSGEGRCATWKLENGHEALAIFSSDQAARNYADEHLDEPWTVVQPPRAVLIDLLDQCQQTGILYAVLDPDGQQGRTLFDIPQVLAAARQQ